ncbi:MAG: vWA domain-containing protein [Myxococcota bacterium]
MSEDLEARVGRLNERLEQMTLSPEQVQPGGLFGLVRPILRLVDWQPAFETEALDALVALAKTPPNALATENEAEIFRETLTSNLEEAFVELEDNVVATERVCSLYREVPVSHLAWLSRLLRTLGRIGKTLDAGSPRATARRLRTLVDGHHAAPPLRLEPPEGERAKAPPEGSDIIALQLAAIDRVIDAAQEETAVIDRRRRLLDAARRLLLDADAALDLDHEGVRVRKRQIVEQITELDRLQAVGLDPHVSLLHQAKSALSRGQRDRLYAALVAMDSFAVGASDEATRARVGEALTAIEHPSSGPMAAHESASKSVDQIFGEEMTSRLNAAVEAGREHAQSQWDDPDVDFKDLEMYRLALDYLAPGSDPFASALLSVDGAFEVGGTLSPVRVTDREIAARLVRHPTPDMVLTQARGAEDVPAAVLTDPRSLIMDLASGRLLTRRYVREEERRTERIEMVGEARVYVLDGSTSMMTDGEGMSRARIRDAILTAELATLLERSRQPHRYTRVVLYYRYFTMRLGDVHKVATGDEAIMAMSDVVSTVRWGGTDIEKALADSFDVIRRAREDDPILNQAQIVLITDGNAVVRDRVVEKGRKRAGDIPIGVSVIALGEENEALRRLVARQRAAGERVFYHYIDDVTIRELCEGGAARRSLHLPPGDLKELAGELGTMLDDLSQLQRTRRTALLKHDVVDEATWLAAHAELGMEAPTEAMKVQREALDRDHRAVRERFRRWFPDPETVDDTHGDDEGVDQVVLLLSTVTEVIGELSDTPLRRRADAVEIGERLLVDARLSPGRYDAIVRHGGERVQAALEALEHTIEDV